MFNCCYRFQIKFQIHPPWGTCKIAIIGTALHLDKKSPQRKMLYFQGVCAVLVVGFRAVFVSNIGMLS
jgi:hypothetical protein